MPHIYFSVNTTQKLTMDETINVTNELLTRHLIDNNIFVEEAPWIVKWSPLGGRGVFASRDIKAGEIVFIDSPLVVGPRCGVDLRKICVVCYTHVDLKMCSKGCGILICSPACENSGVHKKECDVIMKWKHGQKAEEDEEDISRYLTPVRALFLTDYQKQLVEMLKGHVDRKHGFEVATLLHYGFDISEEEESFMRLTCSVLDANAFAVSISQEEGQAALRGLYPLASLANHKCFPNTTHVFDDKQRMICKAALDIKKDEELFHSYTKILFSTLVRRYHLANTKHFCCYCERCKDPTEYNTNLSGIFCNKCKGLMLPVEPLSFKTQWQCKACGHLLGQQDAKLVMSILGSAIAKFVPDGDVEKMLDFIENKTKTAVPACNQIIMELKYKLVFILGYMEGYKWTG